MGNIIRKICSIGTENVIGTEKISRIISVNSIATLTALFAFIIGSGFYYFTGEEKLLYPALLEGVSFLCILPLNYFKWHKIAPLHAQLTHNFAMIYFGILLANAVDATILVAFLFGHAFLFFSREDERKLKLASMIIAGISYFVLEIVKLLRLIQPLEFTTTQRLIVHFTGSAVIITLTILIIARYQKINAKLTDEKNMLLTTIKQQNEELEVKIKERTSELVLANNHIIAYLREISHEIRTPLSSIFYASKLFKEKIILNFEQINDIIYSRCFSGLRIINNILTFEKISKGQYQKINSEFVSLKTFLGENINAAQLIANEKSVIIKLKTKGIPEAVNIDPLNLEKILNNLLINAIKFTGKGTEIIVIVEVSNNILHLEVIDQGEGISTEILPHIFEPFHSVENKFIEGNGLGLNLVQKLVSLFSGDINVTSTNRGTTFAINIPISIGTYKDIKEEATGNLLELIVDTRILVIEDDAMTSRFIKMQLLKAGCRPLFAENYIDGLNLALTESPEIIVMDMNTPGGISGYDAIKRFKSIPQLSNVPIIVMSSNVYEDVEKVIELGAIDYITKPDNKRLLIKAIAKSQKIISTNKIFENMIS